MRKSLLKAIQPTLLPTALASSLFVSACLSNSGGDTQSGQAGGGSITFQEGSFGFERNSAPDLDQASTSPASAEPDKATDLAVTALGRITSLLLADRLFIEQLESIEDAFTEELGSGTEECEEGSITVTANDVEPVAELSSGDSFSLDLNNCDGQNGAIRYSFDEYNGSVNTMLDSKVRIISDFSASDIATGLSGSERGQTDRVIAKGNIGFTNQGTLRDVMVSIKRNDTEASAKVSGGYISRFADRDTPNINATVSLLEDGQAPGARVIAGTPSSYRLTGDDLQFDLGSNRFAAGTVNIEAQGQLRLTVLSTQAIRIELDEAKDGQFEKTCTFSYQALLDGQAAFTATGCQGAAPDDDDDDDDNGGGEPPAPNPLDQIPVLGPILGGIPVLGDALGAILGQLPTP
ncbi:MAG TPA: hypothetical protein VFV39_05445 [Limnobacter sp.]|nr:hypothetical protein [Limnobacter sp.]